MIYLLYFKLLIIKNISIINGWRFFNSFIAGVAQTIIGHPFDTIKTYKQIYFKKIH